MKLPKVVAVCGKGGVGKTVASGALVRIFIERGASILAVDADPAMGLAYILGLQADIKTLGNVREDLIKMARVNKDPDEVVDSTDYSLLEALIETESFSFLAMGRSLTRGCFCPVNSLLKLAVERLAKNYDVVLVDAEAGVEQINREVMSIVNSIIVLIDGSQRSLHSMELIRKIVGDLDINARMGVVMNRSRASDSNEIIDQFAQLGILLAGVIPEDEGLRRSDTLGESIFNLPSDSTTLESVRRIADFVAEA